jgi:hypothetical protein
LGKKPIPSNGQARKKKKLFHRQTLFFAATAAAEAAAAGLNDVRRSEGIRRSAKLAALIQGYGNANGSKSSHISISLSSFPSP